MKTFFKRILKFLAVVAGIAVMFWLYLIFFAHEPIFGPADDVGLGEQSVKSISEDPAQYPVLSREEYPEAYSHMDRIVDTLVASRHIEYRDIFKYDEVRIINDDRVLNAFCTPGGFIYVYSGLIRYLNAEDHLAGVLGHEIAHAEKRHSSLRLQKQFGADQLFKFIVLTTPISARAAWALSILTDLTELGYSREQEAESDTWSVRYLSDTDYACNGTAGFFEKLTANAGASETPEFLSDHPDPASRIADIHEEAKQLGCSTKPADQSQWREFQQSLPPIAEAAPAQDEQDAK